jgi:hypothetical protein
LHMLEDALHLGVGADEAAEPVGIGGLGAHRKVR